MMSNSETISWDGNLIFPNQAAEVVLQSMGTNLRKIAGHSPFDELILRRYFSLLACPARMQSGAKQHGRSRGAVATTFSRRIVSHSPFDWTGNCTGLPQHRNGIRPSVSR
jgi:hypothetical protein